MVGSLGITFTHHICSNVIFQALKDQVLSAELSLQLFLCVSEVRGQVNLTYLAWRGLRTSRKPRQGVGQDQHIPAPAPWDRLTRFDWDRRRHYRTVGPIGPRLLRGTGPVSVTDDYDDDDLTLLQVTEFDWNAPTDRPPSLFGWKGRGGERKAGAWGHRVWGCWGRALGRRLLFGRGPPGGSLRAESI